MNAWYDDSASSDRFFFSVFLAGVLHAAVILGVGFTREQHDPLPQSLEVTLAQRDDVEPNTQADFLAQANQRGSGTLAERQELSSAVATPFTAAAEHEATNEAVDATESPPQRSVVEAQRSRERAMIDPAREQQAREGSAARDAPRSSRSAQIESLMARLAQQQQEYARLPRVARVTAVSTRAADDAAYLFAWKQRIETIGNRHYPPEARRRRLYGDLRLLVALRPDGSVLEIRVLQSSGERVLDDAAVRIVRLAAPFEPFPPSLRERVDVLQIIRTWQFRLNRLTSTE